MDGNELMTVSARDIELKERNVISHADVCVSVCMCGVVSVWCDVMGLLTPISMSTYRHINCDVNYRQFKLAKKNKYTCS